MTMFGNRKVGSVLLRKHRLQNIEVLLCNLVGETHVPAWTVDGYYLARLISGHYIIHVT
jgi:hypothetical protein